MENKKTSETLEQGFVESKLSQTDNPCEKILGETDCASVFNLSEKRRVDVYLGHSEPSHVGSARKLGNRGIKESSLVDGIAGNNQMSKWTMDNYPDNKLLVLTNGNEIKDNDVQVLEGNLEFSGNDGIWISKVEKSVVKYDEVLHARELFQVEKVEEPMEEGDHVLHPHEPSSPTKIEVSGNGINLFVEVFGPMDGISEGNNNLNDTGKHNLGERHSSQEHSVEENGTVSPGVKNVGAMNEGENIVEEQEFTFDVGDLVWVKTRTQLWWPGMITDPSSAANDATKSEKRGSFLVKYFGSANFVWCVNSDLKPFLEFFEQLSGQNNSRNFCGSVEKALCEIGRHVKLKMTCPCFSKDIQILAAQGSTGNMKENSMSIDKKDKFDILSLSQFEPATFVADVRHLACSVYVPGKVELTVVKNRLSAFYCSIGHHELPLHLLRSGSDAAQSAPDGLTSEVMDEGPNNISGGGRNSVKAHDGDLTVSRREKRNRSDNADLVDKVASSVKGFEPRERKKSKYLSYPYVDVNQGLNGSNSGQETEDTNHSTSQSSKFTPPGSCSSTNLRKRGSKKPSKEHHDVCKAADNINACSAELRDELCSLARGCFYLSRSKYSDSLMRFYGSFRIFAFLDADVACKVAGGQQAANPEKCLPQNSTEAEAQMEGTRVVEESENQRVNPASVKESSETDESKKVSITDNPQAKGNVIRKRGKKKKEQVISAGPESTNNSFSVGTNIYPSSPWVINFQQTCSDVPKSSTTPQKGEEASPGLPQVGSIARLPDLNGNHPSFSVDHIPIGGPSPSLGKPSPEPMKERLVSPNIVGVDKTIFAAVPSLKDASITVQNIPQFKNGINGTNQCWNEGFTTRELGSNVINMGLSSFVQQSLQMGLFPSAGKPERKKRKRKEQTSQVASVIPDLNGNVLDMSSSGKTPPDGNHVSPAGEPQQRRRSESAGTESGKTNKVSNSGEAPGGSLLLNFAPGSTLPTKETLVATFSRYGLLRESEILVLDESTVQIVYERTSEARFAFRSLEKSNPFGESLASFKLHCTPAASKTMEKKRSFKMRQPIVPVDALKNPAKPGETPDIAFIKQNVEMMKLTLEKAGNNLSPEMRAKLENEIKVFLDKISSIPGSSSS